VPDNGLSTIGLVIGLGNVGRKYEGTRHNVGFDVLDLVAGKCRATALPETDRYRLAQARYEDRDLVLAWPTTYMNRSGAAVQELLTRFDIQPEAMLVVVDDFALPLGRLRLRKSGSDGGHNGLASIIATIGTQDFPRLRLGIGPAPEGMDPAEFVLGNFTESEFRQWKDMTATAADAVLHSITHRFDETMSRYNATPAQ
jgi:PTH1 family peptidyl-tRNA hydrolase